MFISGCLASQIENAENEGPEDTGPWLAYFVPLELFQFAGPIACIA